MCWTTLDAASITCRTSSRARGDLDGEIVDVTDNDGVEENYGETLFLRLGPVRSGAG